MPRFYESNLRGDPMTPQDREERRLAAKAAGFKVKRDRDMDTDFLMDGDRVVAIDGQWSPKTDKADSFDLCCAISKHRNETPKAFDELPENEQNAWIEITNGFTTGDASRCCKAIFNCAVEIGRSMEASNERIGG